MNRTGNPIKSLLVGLVAFLVTYVILLIIAALFDAVSLEAVANVINRFAVWVALLCGLVYGYSHYQGR